MSSRYLPVLLFVGISLLVSVPAASQTPSQPPYEHSTVSTEDGSIRDDELADFICAKLLANGLSNVSDVKFMANSCYGGGLIDDLARVFGPGGDCEGIPWVAGSASQPDQVAWGWTDEFVNHSDNAGKNLGSEWTDALAGDWRQPDDPTDGAIRNGDPSDTVADDLQEAADNDTAGPNGAELEDPVVASGNGGDTITWDGADKHEAVIFGGLQTDDRHTNNVENVDAALDQAWAGETSSNTNAIDGGTTQELKDAIDAAIANLDADTQFVLYIDDHGDTHFDVLEYLAFLEPTFTPPLIIDPSSGLEIMLPAHEGWPAGMAANLAQNEPPLPALAVQFNFIDPQPWTIALNGIPLPLPPDPFTGGIDLPIPPEILLQPPPYQLSMTSSSPSTIPIEIIELQLDSGPINEAPSPWPDSIFVSQFEIWEPALP